MNKTWFNANYLKVENDGRAGEPMDIWAIVGFGGQRIALRWRSWCHSQGIATFICLICIFP